MNVSSAKMLQGCFWLKLCPYVVEWVKLLACNVHPSFIVRAQADPLSVLYMCFSLFVSENLVEWIWLPFQALCAIHC